MKICTKISLLLVAMIMAYGIGAAEAGYRGICVVGAISPCNGWTFAEPNTWISVKQNTAIHPFDSEWMYIDTLASIRGIKPSYVYYNNQWQYLDLNTANTAYIKGWVYVYKNSEIQLTPLNLIGESMRYSTWVWVTGVTPYKDV